MRPAEAFKIAGYLNVHLRASKTIGQIAAETHIDVDKVRRVYDTFRHEIDGAMRDQDFQELGFQWIDTNPIIYGDGCATCGGERTGRRTVYCSDDCRDRLAGRLYDGVHWIRRAVVKLRGAVCAHCGEILASPVKPGGPDYPNYELIDIDHVVALVDGGTDHLDNLQVLCKACHREKSAIDARLRSGRLHKDFPVATPTLEGL